LIGPDQDLPDAIRVRHGRNSQGKVLHYYLNFSGTEQSFPYPYANGADLLTNAFISKRQTIKIAPWDLVLVAEH
jgi:beta-galactosidase